jgi:hypothetical protein
MNGIRPEVALVVGPAGTAPAVGGRALLATQYALQTSAAVAATWLFWSQDDDAQVKAYDEIQEDWPRLALQMQVCGLPTSQSNCLMPEIDACWRQFWAHDGAAAYPGSSNRKVCVAEAAAAKSCHSRRSKSLTGHMADDK